MLLKPPALRRGDTVGLLSPSSEISSFPRRTERAIQALEQLGFRTVVASHATARRGASAGSPHQRVDDLHALFDDDRVAAVLCTTGGWTSNAMLPLLDWSALARRPKIFCGFSDVSALLLALHARTGMCTFHGPTLLPSFGDFGGPIGPTVSNFLAVAERGDYGQPLPAPSAYSDESLFWDRDDTRPRQLGAASPWVCLREGEVEGPLLGGNLTTLGRLIGTPFLPSFDGAILFLEQAGGSTAQVESALQQLVQAGLFAQVRGLVFGRPSQFSDQNGYALNAVLRDLGEQFAIPVLADVDFGHTEPRLTMPLGVRGRLDAGRGQLTLLESAVIGGKETPSTTPIPSPA